MKKICIVVSSPMTVKSFLLKHIKVLENDYSIYIVSSEDTDYNLEFGLKSISKKINIDRKINILNDINSIYDLYKFIRRENFDMILSVTPKAGFVSAIASFLNFTKIRTHFFTGQVWATKQGLFRILLKTIDKLIVTLNTNNLTDSFSQKNFLIKENITTEKRIKVLNKGSISGVDIKKFNLNFITRKELQYKYNVKGDEIVFMFIGRLNTDKGVFDLVKAFGKILNKYNNVKLFLIGPDEENIESKISEFLKYENVVRINYVSNPERILNVADILVLPSYREGFGTTVIEAASLGIPCVASNIYGLCDAIIDNHTGLLHQVKDIDDIVNKYEYFLNNPDKIKEYGQNAKDRVYLEFEDNLLSEELKKYIDEKLD